MMTSTPRHYNRREWLRNTVVSVWSSCDPSFNLANSKITISHLITTLFWLNNQRLIYQPNHPPLRGNAPFGEGWWTFKIYDLIYIYVSIYMGWWVGKKRKRIATRYRLNLNLVQRLSDCFLGLDHNWFTEQISNPTDNFRLPINYLEPRRNLTVRCLIPHADFNPPNTITEESDYEILSCLWNL